MKEQTPRLVGIAAFPGQPKMVVWLLERFVPDSDAVIVNLLSELCK